MDTSTIDALRGALAELAAFMDQPGERMLVEDITRWIDRARMMIDGAAMGETPTSHEVTALRLGGEELRELAQAVIVETVQRSPAPTTPGARLGRQIPPRAPLARRPQ